MPHAEQLLAGGEPLGTPVSTRREVVFWARLSTVTAHASTFLLVEEALAGGQEESGLELAISAQLGPGICQGSGGHLPAGRSLTLGHSVASQEPFTC